MPSASSPVYLRMARPKTPIIFDDKHNFVIGKSTKMQEGRDVTIVSTGIMLSKVMDAAKILKKDNINAEIINMATIKPLDKDAVIESAKKTGFVVTCEDHNVIGGLGGAVAEVLSESAPTKLLRIGLKGFAQSGTYEQLYKRYGLDAEGIVKKIKQSMK